MCRSAGKLIMAAVAACMASAQPMVAQWAPPFEREWSSRITREQFNAICDAIEPDAEQLSVLETLFEAHAQEAAHLSRDGLEWKRAAQAEADALKLQEPDDPAVKAARDSGQIEGLKREAQWADKFAALDLEFEDDLVLLLHERQQELWTAYARDRQWAILGELPSPVPWGTVHLCAVVGAMALEPSLLDTMRPILAEYESVATPLVDQVIAASIRHERNRWRRVERLQEFSNAGASTMEQLEKVDRDRFARDLADKRRLLAPQIALRSMNRIFGDQVIAQLPPELAARFKRAMDQASEPSAYRLTRVHRAVERLTSGEALTPAQKTAVTESLIALNERIDQSDEQRARVREEEFTAMVNDPYDFEKKRRLQKRRKEIDADREKIIEESYAKLLLEFPEQLAR